jgi:hypothetical protein
MIARAFLSIALRNDQWHSASTPDTTSANTSHGTIPSDAENSTFCGEFAGIVRGGQREDDEPGEPEQHRTGQPRHELHPLRVVFGPRD